MTGKLTLIGMLESRPPARIAARAMVLAALLGLPAASAALGQEAVPRPVEAPAVEAPDAGFTVPALPEVIANFDTPDAAKSATEAPASDAATAGPAKPETPATGTAAAEPGAPVVLALPELPEPGLSTDLAAGTPAGDLATGPVAAEALKLDIPAVPEVKLSVASTELGLDAEKLRTQLQPARARYRLGAAEVESFVAAYETRGFRAIWLDAEGHDLLVSPRAAALRETLAGAGASGLDANRLVAILPEARSGKIAAERRAETDIAFSLAAFIHARDLRGGRLEPSRVSSLMTPKLELPEASALLGRLAATDAAGISAAILDYEPRHAGYRALKAALAKAREDAAKPVLTGSVAGMAGAPQPAASLPKDWLEGPLLAFDKSDARVPLLRTRLGLPAGGDIYDRETRAAVMTFQRANRLAANGRLTPKTRAALENPDSPLKPEPPRAESAAPLDRIIANMERWRWLPADLGERHILVNIPDYDLKMFVEGKMIHSARVIVGRATTQTPVFSDTMEYIVVNPSWGVPQSIIRKEFLPKMAADPDYATKRGYQVTRRGNQVYLRQPPGSSNALGYIKMMFPNDHSVYLHDTPTRGLFANETRALSHGCVRVQNPFALAEKVMEANGLTEAQLKGMIGRGERMIRLKEHLPVHLAYFTAFVDEQGELQTRRDIYGHDIRIRNALGS